MRFILTPITRADARAIAHWPYGGLYWVYDGNPASFGSLLQARFLYHSVYDEGELAFPPDRGDLQPQGHQSLREGRLRAGRDVRREETGRGEGMAADEARGVIPPYTPRK